MTGSSIWDRLGIAPTDDAAVLRQAYAERLKHVRPDDDPEGFRLLRDAFDAARRSQVVSRPEGTPRERASRPLPTSTPVPPAPKPAADPALLARDAVQAKLHIGWPLDAARAWRDNEAQLTLADAERLQGAVAEALMANISLDLAALNEAITMMRWEEAACRFDAPPAVLDLLGRRAAEAWWAELQAAAHARFRWPVARQLRNRAARILLLRAPGPIRRRFPYIFLSHDLGYWLIAWPQHRRFLGPRLSPERLGWCQAAMYRWDAKWVVRLWTAYVLSVLLAIPFAIVLIVADLF